MKKENLEILLEDISSKFDLVLEGHEVLRSEIRETRTELKKDIDLCNFKIDTLNKKIDAVAADLKAHRSDTEAHHGVYTRAPGTLFICRLAPLITRHFHYLHV